MRFTKIPDKTFKQIQINSGILLEEFDPTKPGKPDLEKVIGATSGGVAFEAIPTFSDYGEDIDNCPKNMKELKKLDSVEAKLSGSFTTITPKLAKLLIGAAAVEGNKITPRKDLEAEDFIDLWWVGDYSDNNGDEDGGFVAIHLLNSLSTGGFKMQSTDKQKGKFDFEFTGHFSMDDQDKVPYEVYVAEEVTEPVMLSEPRKVAKTTEVK